MGYKYAVSLVFAAIVLALLLSGCNLIRPCVSSVCGCWNSTTFKYETIILDTLNKPAEDIELFCPETNKSLGTTNENGEIAIRFRTESSPGCGISTCSRLSVMQNQQHLGYLSLRLSKAHKGHLTLEGISKGNYELTATNSKD